MKIIIFFAALIVGIAIGGYFFSDTQPRSFLAVNDCKNSCLNPNELMGLLGSVGVQKLPDLIPLIVKETDKTVVIESPLPQAAIHYVVIPKKDIKDIADMTESDKEYLIDAYAVIEQIIKEKNLRRYRVYTNGPGYQTVNYLHFHLMDNTK